MRFTPIALGACLLGLVVSFGSANLNLGQSALFADDSAMQAFVLDESIFNIEEGRNAQYYKEAELKLRREISRFTSAVDDVQAHARVLIRANESLTTIFRNLAFCADAERVERNRALGYYVSRLAALGDVDALIKIRASENSREKPDAERLKIVETSFATARVNQAVAEKNPKALVALGDEIIGATLADPSKAGMCRQMIERIASVNREAGTVIYAKAIKQFGASDSAALKKMAATFAGQKRFAELVGNEMVVEGLYLDGSEINWEDYRGKVVLIDFWATWCGPCVSEIPNVLKLYSKYRAAGFEVLGYSLDDNLEALKEFEKEKNLPWKTASRKMSTEAKGKQYINVTEYYDITSIPTMILVGRDGKVIDTDARGARLKQNLEKLFPSVN